MTMPQWVAISLDSKSPTERATAIAWLKQNHREVSASQLVRALQMETVPLLRANLNDVLAQRKRIEPVIGVTPKVADAVGEEPRLAKSPDQLDAAATLRHELSPAIGWIRLAADREIANFSSSRTNVAIGKLQRRIDGLISILKEDALLFQTVSFRELVLKSWPDPNTEPVLDTSLEDSDFDFEITTDENLFSTMLANVYQNAIDASGGNTAQPIRTTWGTTQDRFWLRVTNPFAGEHFRLGDVAATGVTSKPDHQGGGIFLISKVAKQLDLLFTIEGSSGTATASIGGKIVNG